MERLGERCWFVAGDFFAERAVGTGAYLLKSVIHDWLEHVWAGQAGLTGAARALPRGIMIRGSEQESEITTFSSESHTDKGSARFPEDARFQQIKIFIYRNGHVKPTSQNALGPPRAMPTSGRPHVTGRAGAPRPRADRGRCRPSLWVWRTTKLLAQDRLHFDA